MKRTPPAKQISSGTIVAWARRYWIAIASGLLLTLVLVVGSPAWAAPVAKPLNQTVPRPTPTSESSEPSATATPRPDDDDDNDNNTGSSSDTIVPQSPALLFPEAGPRSDLTGVVTVQSLNVRDEPGITGSIVGTVSLNEKLTIRSRNQENTWWYICCVSGTDTEGWVSAELVEPDFERAQSATLLPLFGAAVAVTSDSTQIDQDGTPSATTANTGNRTGQAVAVELPLEISVTRDPRFAWQGQTMDLTFEISNPNNAEVVSLEFSDELPESLELIDFSTTDDGVVNQEIGESERVLVVVEWPSVQRRDSVAVTLTVMISPDLEDGAVIDNLVAVRAANAGYGTGAVSIGLPPTSLPLFE